MHKNDKIFLQLRTKSEIFSFVFLGKQKKECKILVPVIMLCMHAKLLQSCPTVCDTMDCGLPGSSVHGTLQARILEWFAMPFSRESSWPRDWAQISYYLLHWQSGSLPLTPPSNNGFKICAGEDSWESLDSKEIKPVNPKGNQSWIFIGRTDAEAEAPIFWAPEAKHWLIWKRPWCWERLMARGKEDRGWDGWMASLTQWTWIWANWEIVKDMGAWHAAVHVVTRSQTWLSDWTTDYFSFAGQKFLMYLSLCLMKKAL